MHNAIIHDTRILLPVLLTMKKATAKKTTLFHSINRSILFQYQKDCVELIKRMSASRGKALISIAPGYGRTIIIALALKELLKEKGIEHALIVVPRKILEEQFIQNFARYSLESSKLASRSEKHSVKLEDELKNTSVVVSTLAMFRKRVCEVAPDLFDVVFFDECHELSENDWKTAERLKSAVIGLTATHPSLISGKVLSFFNLQKPTYSYGMASVKLKELANVFIGANYNSDELLNEGKWKFIRPRDIKEGLVVKVKTFASDKLIEKNRKKTLKVGDIVLQNAFNFGKMAIIQEKDLPAMASTNLFVIRSTTITPKFLFDHLQSKVVAAAFRKQLEDLAHGTPIRHISLRDVREILVPLPFSEEHLWKFADIRRSGNIEDFIKARNEIAHLRSAYELYSASEE